MSITSRNYDFAQKTFRRSHQKDYQSFGIKSNAITTFRPSTSIYEELPKRKNNKRNVIQRFNDLCRKMSVKKEEKNKRIKVQSITVDLLRQNNEGRSVGECSKIIENIKQKTIQIERLKSLKSQEITNRPESKHFQPHKQNKSVRLIYNTGGRIIQYTPLVEQQLSQKQHFKLPKKQPSKTYYKSGFKDEEFAPQRYIYQKGSKTERKRVFSVVPKQKKFLETRQSFMDNILPWQSQQVMQTQTYV